MDVDVKQICTLMKTIKGRNITTIYEGDVNIVVKESLPVFKMYFIVTVLTEGERTSEL